MIAFSERQVSVILIDLQLLYAFFFTYFDFFKSKVKNVLCPTFCCYVDLFCTCSTCHNVFK